MANEFYVRKGLIVSSSAQVTGSLSVTGTITVPSIATTLSNAVTFNNGGSGDASGTTYNGSAARTISHNTLGAVPTGRTLTITTQNGLTGGTTAVDLSTNRSWTLELTGQALALHNLATNGLIARTGAGTVAGRTLTAGTGITVTNGDGVSGNPTVALTSNTISGVALGSNLNTLTISSPLSGTSYNGSSAVTIALSSGYGDTQNPYASKTANTFLAAPNGSSGVPTFRAIAVADIPTLNQSTTGAAGSVTVSDTRNVTTTPETINMGVVFDFKANTSNALSDGGTYHGLMTFRQYGSNTDWSGGRSHQLGFTDNDNVWHRSGTSTTWGTWYRLIHTGQSGTVTNTMLANSTISSIALGNNLNTLTMGVSGTGLSGTATYNGSAAVTFTVTSNATSANTVSTIVARDGSGNFSAGTITATLSGNATNVTGTVAIANGGTGQATQQAALNALAGAVTSGQYLRGNGTNVLMSAIQAGDVPTLNQNTTGQAGSVANSLTLNTSGTGLSGTATYNGSSAVTFTVTSNATSANTVSTIVARDASGNFSAGTITATLSGTATTATNWGAYGAVPAAGTSFGTANTIGRSDGNGYTYFGYINSSTGNSENPSVSQVIVTNGSDNFYRKASIAHFTSAVQSNASGNWGINITGNASTATSATSATTATTATTLQTARNINGVSFNGSANILVPSIYDSNYRRITQPGGAEYVTSASTVTGAIRVTLPTGVSNTMVTMRITVYEYTTNESFEIQAGGYPYDPGSNTWANNPFAYITGNPSIDRRFTVRFGHTGTQYCIYIGELASTWSYPQVFVTDVQIGYSNTSAYISGWSIGFEASAFQNVTATITNSQIGYQASTNTANSVVLRDGSGNFSAGTITATLSGNASTATSAGSVTNSITFNNGGSGDASGTAYNGSAARTISHNTIGALALAGGTVTGIITQSSADDQAITLNATDSSWKYLGFSWAGSRRMYFGLNASGEPELGTDTGNTVRVVGTSTMTVGGNQVLHAANYTSYTHTFDSLTNKTSGTGTYTTSGDFRAPIFYDSANTAFFLDPNAGKSLRIAGGIAQNNIVGRPVAYWSAMSATGAVIIKFPGNSGNYGMIHAHIDIYEYSGNAAATIIVGGHNWNGSWYNINAEVIGTTDKPVRVGFKDGRYCIVIGNGSSSWSYGQVVLRKIQNATHYDGSMEIAEGYSVAIESDSYSYISSDLRNLRTPVNFTAGGTITGGNDVRSPIFYDSNNTAYYVDPASGAILNKLSLGTTTLTDVTLGVNGAAHISSGNYLYMGGNIGSSGGWGTREYQSSGVRYLNSNGFYFDNTGYGSSWAFHSNGNSGNITATVDFRAPIFYDSNDTGYYIDPHSNATTYATRLRSGILFGPNQAWGAYLLVGGNGKHSTYQDSADVASVVATDGNLHLDAGSGKIMYLNYYDGSSIYFCNGANGVWGEWTGAIFYSYGQIRSAIYYDYGNTAYYVDAASTSNVNAMVAYSYQGNGNVGGTGNASWHPSGIYSAGYNWLYGGINGGGNSGTNFSDLRASIFYDVDNTGYYLDPTSTGTSLNMAGSVRQVNYNKPGLITVASGTDSSGASIAIQQETSEGWTCIFADYEPNTGWGFYHDNPNNFFSFTSEATTGQIRSFTVPSRSSGNRTAYEKFRIEQSTGDTITGRIAYANESSRSPIFYDTNNTGYYVDPNSISRMIGIGVGESYYSHGYPGVLQLGSTGYNYNFLNGTWASSITTGILANCLNQWEIAIHDSGERVVSPFLFDGGGNHRLLMGRDIGWGTMFIEAANSFRAPIFYDSNNTAYYVDPASTSVFNVLNLEGGPWRFGSTGGSYITGGSDGSGYYIEQVNSPRTLRIQSSNGSGTYTQFFIDGANQRIYTSANINFGIATTDFSYTASDNTGVVGGNPTNNRLFINGSIQLLGNADAIVFGRGTSTFLKDEELGFGWGGGWFMQDGTWNRTRNNTSIWAGTGQIGTNGGVTVGYGGNSAPSSGAIFAGIVGIGTQSPTSFAQLHIDGSGKLLVRSTSNNWGQLQVANPNDSETTIAFAAGGTGSPGNTSTYTRQWVVGLSPYSTGTDRFSITNSTLGANTAFTILNGGNVGINTTSPSARLHTVGGTAMSGGWNRSLLLEATFPVIVFNSNSSKYSGIGVDYSVSDGGFYFWVNGSSTDISGTGTIAMTINTGNYVTANGSFRAPIFYDSNNTGYYVDPASTSVINSLTALGTIRAQNGSADWDTLDLIAGGATHIINSRGSETGLSFRMDNTERMFLSNIGGVRSNAGFGSDSIGTTSPNSVGRVQFPQGSAFSSDGSTGAIKIRLPFRNNNAMWAFKVRIYNYANNTIGEYHVGAYSYNSGGYNAAASYQGSAAYGARNVRFGNDGTYDCVWIGETNSGWSYPVVSVTDVMGGFRNGTFATFSSGWDISIVQSFGTVESTITPSITSTNITSESAIYSPIFYDSNNTGYYVDPASTSFVNVLNTAGSITVGNSTSSDIYMSDSDEGTRRIHCNSNRIGFLNDSNGWGAYCADNGDWTTDTISYAGASHRSPIFYDSNNTNYYVDPNGGSYFNTITFDGVINGNINSATFRPNDANYGAWRIAGSRNGWGGIEFSGNSNGNVCFMVYPNSNETGIYNVVYGWQMRWYGGTLYVYKNTFGGGTEATVLDSVNYTSYLGSVAYGGVGSYVIALVSIGTGNDTAGSTYAGSSLFYWSGTSTQAGLNLDNGGTTVYTGNVTSLGLSGTWRIHTVVRAFNFGGNYVAGLFYRIS